MPNLTIIAEAAQGYEGSPEVARLLVRAAAAGGADAIKFQLVYADDLSVPGYQYHDLFRGLEMPAAAWQTVRDECGRRGIGMLADVFGSRSLAVAKEIAVDGIKLHSTTFFDDQLTRDVLATRCGRYFISVGGIEPDEIAAFVKRHGLRGRGDVTILFGYQAEPTPVDRNNLARIAALRQMTQLDVGFMDHSDGDGPDILSLSAMAAALGVTVFEKHITLDRKLEMEDFVSALGPESFATYAAALRRLPDALGSADLAMTDAERAYRGRALKRVVAARDLPAGVVLGADDVTLLRPAESAGLFDPAQAIGRRLTRALARHAPVTGDDLTS